MFYTYPVLQGSLRDTRIKKSLDLLPLTDGDVMEYILSSSVTFCTILEVLHIEVA